jgi:hypothetical protein
LCCSLSPWRPKLSLTYIRILISSFLVAPQLLLFIGDERLHPVSHFFFVHWRKIVSLLFFVKSGNLMQQRLTWIFIFLADGIQRIISSTSDPSPLHSALKLTIEVETSIHSSISHLIIHWCRSSKHEFLVNNGRLVCCSTSSLIHQWKQKW